MILARLAPERAEALQKRAVEYAESRLICARHFPSDLEAGHAIAAAVVARLATSAQFQADLERARAELAASATKSSPADEQEPAARESSAGAHP
jgi:acid phosphatase (class A)